MMLYDKEKYTGQRRYNVDFEDPKNRVENKSGFLSSDNAKRDEFSNTVRTNQWRESLKVSCAPAQLLGPRVCTARLLDFLYANCLQLKRKAH